MLAVGSHMDQVYQLITSTSHHSYQFIAKSLGSLTSMDWWENLFTGLSVGSFPLKCG